MVVTGTGGGDVEATAAGVDVVEVAAAADFVSQGFGRGGSDDIYDCEGVGATMRR